MKSGEWDPGLFARYKVAAPGGPLRRLLASKILQQNEFAIKKIVGQLTGRSERRFMKLGKVYDSDRLEWDDALQAGYIGFARALESYDPSRCTIMVYARWWIRYELQKQTGTAATICTPSRKEDQRPHTSLIEKPALEAMAGADFGLIATIEGITPEMVEAWGASGQWPETLEEARELAVPRVVVAVPVEPPITPWEAFLRDVVRVRPAGRVPRVHAERALVRHYRSHGLNAVQPLQQLITHFGEPKFTVRPSGSRHTFRGFRGFELRASALAADAR